MPAWFASYQLVTTPPGGTVKSFTAVEKTVGTVSAPDASKGGAVRPMLAQIALTGRPAFFQAWPQSVTKRAPFDMPMPTSGVAVVAGVVSTRWVRSRRSRARSGFAVSEALFTSQRLSPVRSVLEVDTKP